MFTKKFLSDLAERAISTFAQSMLGALALSEVGWDKRLLAVAIATGASVLKGLVATQVGNNDTAALLPKQN